MAPEEFEDLLIRLDALVGELEAHPDARVRARALDLLRHVDAVHREGLGRLAGLIRGRDPELMAEAALDPVVGLLLSLYDLAPAAPRAFIPLERLEASAAAARARRGPAA
jgi:hypothetical protein